MNKKGIIALVVIVVLIVVGLIAFGGEDTTVNNGGTDTTSNIPEGVDKSDYAPVTSESTDTTLLGRLKKASVGVTEDGRKVALTNGTASFTIDGTSDKATVTLGNIAIEQTVGARKDVIATVGVAQTGGTYTYIVLFDDKSGALTDKSYGLVGKGVTVTGVRSDAVTQSGDTEYVVTVSFTEGGAAKNKFFIVEKGAFNLAKTIEL
ncbi:MAG: hypothetical protein Q8L64_03300 [bacterium]|nr:hypothetical protein [bacterium]